MMTTRQWEELLGELFGKFRATEIEPLSRRLDMLEQRLALEERIAKLEARAGLESGEARLILPEHRNGGGHGGDRRS